MIHQGETLEKFIRNNKINITQLAYALGVSKQSLYNWFTFPILPNKRRNDILKALDLHEEFFKSHSEHHVTVNEPTAHYGKKEKTMVQVEIDGSDESLESAYQKLRAINSALKSIE
jgi:hypothetical protein